MSGNNLFDVSWVTLEAVLSSNTFGTGMGGFSTAKPNRRQPRTFGVVGGSYWGCGFVDDHLSYAKSGVCTSKTSSGVMMALNKYLYEQADRRDRVGTFCTDNGVRERAPERTLNQGQAQALCGCTIHLNVLGASIHLSSILLSSILSRGVLYFSKIVRLLAAESFSD